ncbi:MAG: CubicO group peptidase (beta-lactamase class C family) [Candidatus Azotimanducaceae bacterium]|jgi:CubicO group peptidase (beta-lactamase class C family)
MNRLLVLILATFGLLVSGIADAKPLPTVKAERQGMSTERLQRITDITQQYVDEGKLAGVITMVARRGKIVHFEAVGSKGAGDDTPLEKDDLFRIYSMTKPITATALMQLYEQGKFHLSDPVSKYVPELKDLKVLNAEGELEPVKSEMTMQQLLTHTTGLSYGFNPKGDPVDKLYVEAELWKAKDLDDFAVQLAKLPLKFHPGDQWHYSVAVDVTGLVVQRLSGQAFDAYLAEHIFEPLGMADTFFAVPDGKVDRFLPNHFLNPKDGKLTQITTAGDAAMQNYRDVSLFSGGGGLVSSTMDYMRWAEMMRNGGELDGVRILGPKTVKYMATNHLDASMVGGGSGEQPTLGAALRGFGFGLGFGLVTDTAAGGVMGSVGEFNWGGAAGTVFWIDPVEELVVVGMIQLMGSPYSFRSDLKVATYQALNESLE